MFSKNFQRKYALTDQGVKNVKKGAFWTVIVNLVVMGGMSILYLLMYGLMGTFTDDQPLPNAALLLGLVVVFLILSFVTHLQQYYATYGLVYNEVRSTRLSLAERLRKLPLGYFGKRDLADLTETIMGDVNRMEHVWSHVLGYLYGAYISTAIIAVCLLVYDWRLAIACLWGVPVAFGLLFGTRKISARTSERTKKAAIRVSDGIQEALENVREIRATNQEERYLAELNQKIDDHEKVTIQGELGTGIFVNAASVIMRLGVATTILVGAGLILSGQIDFMLLFLFLLVITRVYAPFDQSLALIAEMFVSQVSADRMNEIYDTPTAEGAEVFQPKGHDIEFDHVGFAYDKKKVLDGVSFTAREGEVTALVGPSGSGKSTCARLAARLWDVTEGSIKVGGVDISTVDPEALLTDYSIRKVWLPKTLAYILREWKKSQDELRGFLGDEYQDFDLVVALPNGRPCEDRIILKEFEKLREKAGLPKVVFHSLRHSSTTYKLKLNHGDLKATQGDTGHAQIDMITSVYAHILDEDRKVNAQKFEDAFYASANPDLRTVRPPAKTRGPKEPESVSLDLEALVEQLRKSPELANTLAALLASAPSGK